MSQNGLRSLRAFKEFIPEITLNESECVNLFDFTEVPLKLLLDLEKSERSIFREIKKGTEDGIKNRNKKRSEISKYLKAKDRFVK